MRVQLACLATRIWRVATGGLMLAVTLITLTQVFSRYVLNRSLVEIEELNRLLYVWLLLIAAAGAKHMRIGLIADKPQFARPLALFATVCSVLCLILLMWGGWTLQGLFALDRYTTLDLSKIWYFMAVIVGGGFWMIALLWSALRHNDRDQS